MEIVGAPNAWSRVPTPRIGSAPPRSWQRHPLPLARSGRPPRDSVLRTTLCLDNFRTRRGMKANSHWRRPKSSSRTSSQGINSTAPTSTWAIRRAISCDQAACTSASGAGSSVSINKPARVARSRSGSLAASWKRSLYIAGDIVGHNQTPAGRDCSWCCMSRTRSSSTTTFLRSASSLKRR